MPYIIGLIWGGLLLILESSVGRILIALGISYITYQGIDVLMDSILSSALGFLNVNSSLSGLIGLTRLDQCINVVCSAVSAKFAINGLTSGKFTKLKLTQT